MTAPSLTLEVGKRYRAKRPRRHGDGFNDREILWIARDGDRVQYDGPAVALGRHFPTVSRDKFLAWASHEVAP